MNCTYCSRRDYVYIFKFNKLSKNSFGHEYAFACLKHSYLYGDLDDFRLISEDEYNIDVILTK